MCRCVQACGLAWEHTEVEMLSDLPVAAAVAWCAEALTQSACLLIDSDHIQM